MSIKNDLKNAKLILKRLKKEGMSREVKNAVLEKETSWTGYRISRTLDLIEKEQQP